MNLCIIFRPYLLVYQVSKNKIGGGGHFQLTKKNRNIQENVKFVPFLHFFPYFWLIYIIGNRSMGHILFKKTESWRETIDESNETISIIVA